MKVFVEMGDITTSSADAIVNAANPYLRGGGGVDGAIQRAAGPELLAACRQVPTLPNQPAFGVPHRCAVGDARITPGFLLPAKFVIHAVGPVYSNYNRQDAARLLASTHLASLKLAVEAGCRSVAFPAISCGLYGYPIPEAAKIAMRVVHRGGPWDLDEIRFVMFTVDCYDSYQIELGVSRAEQVAAG